MSGPYQTEAQARTAAGTSDLPPAAYPAWATDRLHAALTRAGIQVGEYDRHVLGWLAGWEPTTVEVIAALIERAHPLDASAPVRGFPR